MTAQLRGFTTTGTTPADAARGHKQLDLAIAAAAYASAIEDQPTHPREETQDRLQQIGVYYARSSIGPLITKARAANMLTPARRGKAAGELTPHAHQLLTTANFQAPWYTPTRTLGNHTNEIATCDSQNSQNRPIITTAQLR